MDLRGFLLGRQSRYAECSELSCEPILKCCDSSADAQSKHYTGLAAETSAVGIGVSGT